MAKVNSAIGIEYNSREIRAVELVKDEHGAYKISAYGNERFDTVLLWIPAFSALP